LWSTPTPSPVPKPAENGEANAVEIPFMKGYTVFNAEQVQVMAYGKDGELTVTPPDVDPRGLGFTSILTQIFGLPTTLDPQTQELLDQRNALLRLEERTAEQERRLIELSSELKRLGFLIEDREPEYALFLRAFEGLKREGRATFTPEEIMAKNKAAKRILKELMTAGGSAR
jgi:hypothetical protein